MAKLANGSQVGVPGGFSGVAQTADLYTPPDLEIITNTQAFWRIGHRRMGNVAPLIDQTHENYDLAKTGTALRFAYRSNFFYPILGLTFTSAQDQDTSVPAQVASYTMRGMRYGDLKVWPTPLPPNVESQNYKAMGLDAFNRMKGKPNYTWTSM